MFITTSITREQCGRAFIFSVSIESSRLLRDFFIIYYLKHIFIREEYPLHTVTMMYIK